MIPTPGDAIRRGGTPQAAAAGMVRSLLALAKSAAARDVTSLGLGTAVSQAILIVGAPIFLRLYEPADFGLYSLAYGWIMTVAMFTTWKIDQLIVVVASRLTAVRLLVSLACLALATATLILASVILAEWVFGHLLPATASGLFWMAPLSGAAFSIMIGLRSYSVRLGRFRLVSLAQIARASLFVGGAIATALLWQWPRGSGAQVILGWQIAGDLVALLLYLAHDRRLLRFATRLGTIRRSLSSLRTHGPTLGVLATADLLSTLNQQLALSVVTIAFGATAAGWFSFATLLACLPITIIGAPVADVFRQRLASLYARRQPIMPAILVSTAGMTALAVVAYGLIATLAQPVLGLVMGDKWAMAHVSVSILAISYAFCFIGGPPGSIALILTARRFLLGWQVARITCTAALAAVALLVPMAYTTWLVMKVVIDCIFFIVQIASGFVLARNLEGTWRPAHAATSADGHHQQAVS